MITNESPQQDEWNLHGSML